MEDNAASLQVADVLACLLVELSFRPSSYQTSVVSYLFNQRKMSNEAELKYVFL